INHYDLVYIPKTYEYLLDPNLWICKYNFDSSVHVYASQEYISRNTSIDHPKCLENSNIIGHSPNQKTGNVWSFKANANDEFHIKIQPHIYIDTDYIQLCAAGNALGVVKLEKLLVELSNDRINSILSEYELPKAKWSLYVKSNSKNPRINECIKEIINLLQQFSLH
ncbi:type 2 periplasmic-binding domain-containing protein, partial [Fangia hongkongensis]